MDAVYSGQAGTLAFLEGAEVRVLRANHLDSEFAISREGAAYLFQGCNDIVVLRGTRPDLARAQFMLAWEADRALRLILICLEPEAEGELRVEAADCLESLLSKKETVASVENELYSRPLPQDADVEFLSNSSKWPIAAKLIADVVSHQPSIIEYRRAWDDLASTLFEDSKKLDFEERAIRLGAFRILASADAGSRNFAVLACYKALSSLPNARAIVTEWTKPFKSPLSRRPILPEVSEESEEATIDSEARIESYPAFENALRQQSAIIEKMKAGSTNLARRYTEQLVHSQLANGGPEFAAKSLCNLAQEAKYLGLYSLQLEWAQRAVDICPSDAWAHGQAADALLQFSRLDEALGELALSEAYGDAQFAATGRARILRHQGKLDEALAAFRSARREFPAHEGEPFTWSGSAETLRDMWRFDDALKEYEEAIARFPNEIFLWCGRASVLADLGRLEEALRAYDEPHLHDHLVALNGKSSVLKEMGRFNDALEVAARAIELFPTDPIARCVQAEALRGKGDLFAALQVYSQVKSSYPTIGVAYGGYAEVLRDMKRIDEAITAYQEAYTIFPYDSRVATGYANIRKVNDELSESLQIYEKNVRQFPYDLVSKSGRADLLKRLGHYDDALNAYDQIIGIWPNYKAARNGKAAILVVRGQFKQAEALLPTNSPNTRDDWIAWHVRGMILLRTNDLDKAIKHFRDGGIQIPFARERRYFDSALAVARMRLGQFEGAVQALSDTEGVLPNILRFHAYAGAGNIDRAKATYIELSTRCSAQLVDLRDAIATRFGIIQELVHHNDNWIFERESEAILREAA